MNENDLTRREFVAVGAGAGFALAVLPITSWAVSTSTEGIAAGAVTIPLADGKSMPGYQSMPKGKGPFPAVIVIHEIFGVHEDIQDVTRRLAKQGYLAVAPYLYSREGEVAGLENIDEIRSKVVSKVKMGRVMSDLDSTVKWLEAGKKADLSKLAVTGFCWGGLATWMFAAHSARVKAGIAWYGRLNGERNENQPRFPIDVVGELKAPVLGLYGGKDKGIPLTQVEEFKARLKEASKNAAAAKSEFVIYPEAEHAFHADYRPSYDEAAAKDGWAKMLAWLKKNGV